VIKGDIWNTSAYYGDGAVIDITMRVSTISVLSGEGGREGGGVNAGGNSQQDERAAGGDERKA